MNVTSKSTFEKYSKEEVAASERSCCIAVLARGARTIVKVAPAASEIFVGLSDEMTCKAEAHLRSYTERILLLEDGGRLFGIAPSLYPSSTLGIALAFDGEDISGEDILRLAAEEEYKQAFVFDESIELRPSRMSDRLESLKPRFSELFCRLSRSLFDMEALRDADAARAREELISRIYAVSELVGCSVEYLSEEGESNDYSATDLPLFVAFLISFFACARENAPLRSVGVSLFSSSSAATVSVRFETQRSLILSPVLIEWESLCADRNMTFSYAREGQRAEISFQPLRRDWSYLGLKQEINFFD